MNPLLGVDVSEYQGKINWAEFKASGHVWAEIKATEGLGHEDSTFAYNWQRAKGHGIVRIAYHFLRPEYDGAQQASYLHASVRSHGRFEVGDGVMLDLEEMSNQSPNHVIASAEDFVTEILKTTRAGVFLYTNYNFWVNVLGNRHSAILGKCALHQASWHSHPAPLANWPNGPSMQQYAADGRVPGIPGQVDLDWAFCSLPTLKALCRESGRH